MLAVRLRDLELGSNSIGSRDEDRILESSRLEVEQSTEATDDRVGSDALGRLDDRLDEVDEVVPGVDRDSC